MIQCKQILDVLNNNIEMSVKCTLCGVNIRVLDLMKCKCENTYHKVCAVQAIGKPIGVIDACCGDVVIRGQ